MGVMTKLFILHGWAYSTEKWQALTSLLEKKNYQVIMLAIPGLTEETTKVWTLDDYVEWLGEKLKPEKSPIIIAHSNGGRIALAFAAKYPKKLKQLILIDSAGILHNELPIRIKRFVFAKLAKFGKKISQSDKMRQLLYKLARSSDYKNASPIMRKTMAKLISEDLRNLLSRVRVPTLIIWGRRDKLTPVSDALLMKEEIPQAELFIIEEARHSPQFTHPEQVFEQIERVIKKDDERF